MSIDPVAQVMTLDWEIVANCGGDTNIACLDGDIFFDRCVSFVLKNNSNTMYVIQESSPNLSRKYGRSS